MLTYSITSCANIYTLYTSNIYTSYIYFMCKQQITWYFSIEISVYSNVALWYSHEKKSDSKLQDLVTHQFLKMSDYNAMRKW